MISKKEYRSPNCKVLSHSRWKLLLKLWPALDRPSVEEDKHELEDNAQTIRANWSPSQHPVPLAQPPSANIGPIVEDYSDIADGEELEHKVADFKVSFISNTCGAVLYSLKVKKP